MKTIRLATALPFLAGVLWQHAAIANTDSPPLIGTTWHIHQCVKPIDDEDGGRANHDSDVQSDGTECATQTELKSRSYIHVAQGFGNSVIAIFKLQAEPSLQVFSGTVEKTERIDDEVIGHVIRFHDSPNNTPNPVNKLLHLYLAQTRENQNIGGKSCANWLRERAKDGSPIPIDGICDADADGRFRNVIFWRIQEDREGGTMRIQIPPDDGQGSGSDEPPQ